MQVPKSIIKDIKAALGVARGDVDAVWLIAAASVLENKAREIRVLCDAAANTQSNSPS